MKNSSPMKKLLSLASALVFVAAIPAANAHRAWIAPAATVLSGDQPWVAFDAAVTNDIFHINHAPIQLKDVKALAPDGSEIGLENPHTSKQRSTFDLQLKQKGTYKVFLASGGLRARWETESGERGFYPPRGVAPTKEGFEKAVPKKAKNLDVSYGSRRIETFVTSGTPDTKALKPTNEGLELVPVTHPNDLFAGEKAQFKFLIDGKPAVGAEVEIIPGGVRYRNDQAAITLKTDKDGLISVTWPQAGMYWLSAEYEDNKAKKPATKRTGSYVATFEVLPQ